VVRKAMGDAQLELNDVNVTSTEPQRRAPEGLEDGQARLEG
jgi:hypothetical protein